MADNGSRGGWMRPHAAVADGGRRRATAVADGGWQWVEAAGDSRGVRWGIRHQEAQLPGRQRPRVDDDGERLSVTAGQHRRTAGESCGFEVDGGRRGGSEATTAEDAGFEGEEAAANGKAEPWGGEG